MEEKTDVLERPGDGPSMDEILASIRRILSEDGDYETGFETVGELIEHIKSGRMEPNGSYGMFQSDAAMLKFRGTPKSEEILADIRTENEKQGRGNIVIPETDIELINFSACPKCETIHTFQDLERYYSRPVPMQEVDMRQQMRKDTRVCCKECREYFLPALIIVDGTPVDETQFLCRMQAIDAIEGVVDRPTRISKLKSRKELIRKDNTEIMEYISGNRTRERRNKRKVFFENTKSSFYFRAK